MSYTTLPDRRMPWDNDGSVYALGGMYGGIAVYPTGSQAIAANGSVVAATGGYSGTGVGPDKVAWLFFPEEREITGLYTWANLSDGVSNHFVTTYLVEGSADSTNGLDGTWETASLSGPTMTNDNAYEWRSQIKSVSFTGPKKVVRLRYTSGTNASDRITMWLLHVYGRKAAGETPDDILFIDQDTTAAEYTAPEDFGDQPLGTSVVRQFRVKNASTTKTANGVNLQCNDTDFVISENGTTWVVTIDIASLAAEAESATLYVRCTTPDPGNLLGPRFARIIATVDSWS